MDPYERADIVSDQYDDWRIKNVYLWAGCANEGGGVPRDLRRVSAEPAAGELLGRPRVEERVNAHIVETLSKQQANSAAPAAAPAQQ